jgi:hypothetical protein
MDGQNDGLHPEAAPPTPVLPPLPAPPLLLSDASATPGKAPCSDAHADINPNDTSPSAARDTIRVANRFIRGASRLVRSVVLERGKLQNVRPRVSLQLTSIRRDLTSREVGA